MCEPIIGYFENYTTIAVKCGNYCLVCTSEENCSDCKVGYFLKDNYCNDCLEEDNNCEEC